MMSKTHLSVGIATSLAVCTPTTPKGILSAVIGGCIGSILCDIECRSTPEIRDALYGRFIAAGISSLLLATDWLFLEAELWKDILSQNRFTQIIGIIVMAFTCYKGRLSKHRTFTHSLLYVLLISIGAACILPQLQIPVLAGGISHLVIDTFNMTPVPWLYPIIKKGISFKVCYASKLGNMIFMIVGFATSIALLAWRIYIIVSFT